MAHLLESPRLLGDLGGARSRLEELGFEFSLYYNYYYGVNAQGGANTSNAQKHSGSADLFLRADFERMRLLPGAESLLQVKSNHGENINPDVRALSQPIDDADFDETIYVDQLWYHQSFADNVLQVRLGYVDQQTALDRNAYANSEDKQFMSAFLDNNPIVPLKIGLGASLFVVPVDGFEAILGTADADNEIRSTGFDTAFDDFESLMGYLQIGFRVGGESPRGELPGNYRFGVFFDPRERVVFGTNDPITGEPESDRVDMGTYLSFDQLVYRERAESLEGLGVFVRYGYRDERVHQVAHFWSTGFEYRGLIPGRDRDSLGFGVYQAIASSRFRDRVNDEFRHETGFELYYRVQLTPWLAITPDLQFIDQPGALTTSRDAVVLVLRGRATF